MCARARGEEGMHTHYISVGRVVPTKWIFFSETAWNGRVFQCKNSGKGFQYTCLESSCLSGKGGGV